MTACALTASVAFAQTNAPQPIDLATTLRLAGARSLDVQIARERLLEAKANHQIAAQQFFPWLAPGMNYRRHDGRLQDVVGNEFNASKQSYALGGTIAAQVELGEAWFKTLAARQLVQAADAGLEARQLESVHTAAQAYFDLLKAQAAVGVARDALDISEDFAGQVQRAVEAGLGQKADALRASVQAGRNQLTLVQSLEHRRATSARLAQALHLEATTELAGNESELAPLTLVRTNSSLDSLAAIALHSRPELKQGEAFTAAARKAREGVSKGPWIPSVGSQIFLGGLGGGRNDSAGRLGDSQDYFLGLSWKIGPGGIGDSARRRANEARERVAGLEVEKLRDEILRQVVEAHVHAQSLGDQLAIARNALAAAEETLKLSRERKQFAIGAVLEVIQAEQELTRARLDYVSLVAEHNKAQYALQRAIGVVVDASAVAPGR